MRNIQIVPEDIVVVSEFRLSEIRMIQKAMGNITIAMNLSDPEEKKVHDFFTLHFMEWVNETIETIENA